MVDLTIERRMTIAVHRLSQTVAHTTLQPAISLLVRHLGRTTVLGWIWLLDLRVRAPATQRAWFLTGHIQRKLLLMRLRQQDTVTIPKQELVRGVARNLFWEGINFDQSALSHNDNGFF